MGRPAQVATCSLLNRGSAVPDLTRPFSCPKCSEGLPLFLYLHCNQHLCSYANLKLVIGCSISVHSKQRGWLLATGYNDEKYLALNQGMNNGNKLC